MRRVTVEQFLEGWRLLRSGSLHETRDRGPAAAPAAAPPKPKRPLQPWQTGEDGLPPMTPEDLRRYSRHLILPEVGLTGQRKLKAASVLMIGAGGLGSPLGLVPGGGRRRTLGIVDFDVVDESNLQRQVLHGTSRTSAGRS